MTKPLSLSSPKDTLINKPVHTRDGFLIGRINIIDNGSIVVARRSLVATIFYHIPMHKVRGWDGHAFWLNIDDKESEEYILPTDSKNTTAGSSMTFDLDETVANKVYAEAQSQGINLNTYVNQIIKRFIEWDKFEPKAGLILISKPLLTELFTNRSKEEIISMARRVGKNTVQSTAIFIKGENLLDLNSFLSWLEDEMDSYSIEIRHAIKDNGNHHTYILNHDAGENYSLYHKTVLELIFEEALQKNINILTSNNTTVAFEFENKSCIGPT
ncbi:MAG TPA: hypothetical protein VFJ51_04100 [Nitrososphaeraceae archaeon]|nr:hypothetical protein [Nitrososphaeraceae archaeon]